MIEIVVRESSFKNSKILITFYSNTIPRIGELIYFPHFGKFRVFEVIHHISDDSENNKCMWIELEVWKS